MRSTTATDRRRATTSTSCPTTIPDEIGRQLVDLTASMGLLVSGADLRFTASGRWYAFELNPSPGFSYYEEATGQPIASAIADLLCP